MSLYKCPGCSKSYERIDRHYYHHTIDCFERRFKQLQNKVSTAQRIQREQGAEQTITIQQMQKKFDDDLKLIKDKYDDALANAQSQQNPQLQLLQSELSEQKKLNESKFQDTTHQIRDHYTQLLATQQLEYEKQIKSSSDKLLHIENDYRSKCRDMATDNTILSDLVRKWKQYAAEKERENEKLEQLHQDQLNHVKNTCNKKTNEIVIKNNNMKNRIQQLLLTVSAHKTTISNHKQELQETEQRLRYEADTIYTKMKNSFQEYCINATQEKEQSNDLITDLNNEIRYKSRVISDQQTELNNLSEKYNIALCNIED